MLLTTELKDLPFQGILVTRQHCTLDFGSYTKDLSAICPDLASVFILDNSPGAYRSYPGTSSSPVHKNSRFSR